MLIQDRADGGVLLRGEALLQRDCLLDGFGHIDRQVERRRLRPLGQGDTRWCHGQQADDQNRIQAFAHHMH